MARPARNAASRDVVPVGRGDRTPYALPNCSFAAATTRSGSKPNFLWSSLRGAEAPKVFIPITWPEVPTYRSHPNVDACSTATRAFTLGGSTLSRYSRVWWSKMSQDGIDTTREDRKSVV